MNKDTIAGFTILSSKDVENTPFMDSIYQNLNDVDLFFAFYDPREIGERDILEIKNYFDDLSRFYNIQLLPIEPAKNSTLTISEISGFLLDQGFAFALHCQPDEFFPIDIKDFLLKCQGNGQSVGFSAYHLYDNQYFTDNKTLIRFLNLQNYEQALPDTTIPSDLAGTIHLIEHAKDSTQRWENIDFPIRAREQLAIRHFKLAGKYPLSQASKEILEDCLRKKNNTIALQVQFLETQGYRESMQISLTWTEAYGVTDALIKKFDIKTMAEIGVARGHHSAHLLEANPGLLLYSIDPWGLFLDEHNCMFQKTPEKMEALYAYVSSLLKPFDKRSKIIRSTSKRALQEITDPLDMIFIDADHSYQSVKNDLELWWGKVKVGGIISGHDYKHLSHPGVTVAVDEFFEKKGLMVQQEIGNVWWVQKNDGNYHRDMSLLRHIRNWKKYTMKVYLIRIKLARKQMRPNAVKLIKKIIGENGVKTIKRFRS